MNPAIKMSWPLKYNPAISVSGLSLASISGWKRSMLWSRP